MRRRLPASRAHGRAIAASIVAMALAFAALWAQQPQNLPRAGYVYPAGGRVSTTVRVALGGQFLDGAGRVLVSGEGVEGSVVEHDKPLVGRALTDARDKLQELQRARDPMVQERIRALRERLAESVRRNATPALSERLTIDITIAPHAAVGARQLRVETPTGLTNPVVFQLGQLPEFHEREVKTGPDDSVLDVTLPATVNGRMIPGDIDRVKFPFRAPSAYRPGDVDRYRFFARKDQDLVVFVSARDLIPYLADTVPGWFQATVALLDDSGRELAFADDYRFHPDPVLHYRIPADGRYTVVVKDALDRGRDDFVYRAAIGELPFVTSVFPIGGRAGSVTRVELNGWNLPSNRMAVDLRGTPTGIVPLFVSTQVRRSNELSFGVDTLPEIFEREPNDSPDDAQALSWPATVNGRIQQPGDRDVFRLKGRTGETIVAEIAARRLGSPIDSVLELTDASGRRIAWNDDDVDKGRGLETHHADSRLLATLPASGTYLLRVGDIQHHGGPEFGYRLRVSAPRPDFELLTSPSTINGVRGGTMPIVVTAIRRDGFEGDIALTLKGAPPGFVLSGARIPAGQDRVRVTVALPTATLGGPIGLRIDGEAKIDGRTVTRAAVAADEMVQAFAYRHLVPADAQRVLIAGRGGTRVSSRLVSRVPLVLTAGETAEVRMTVPPAYLAFENLQVVLDDAPDGLSASEVSVDGTLVRFTVHADSTRVKPGLRGNLIATMWGERRPPAGSQTSSVRRRIPLGTLPAVAFEIVPGK